MPNKNVTAKPKFVHLHLMYRDGANYKTSESYYLSNKKRFTELVLTNNLNKLSENPFVPDYYGLPTLAPLENEFLPAYDDLSHSFIELADFEFSNEIPGGYVVEYDIEECINTCKNRAVLFNKRKLAKDTAINDLIKQIEQIKKIKI